MDERQVYWRGRKIEELTREELLLATRHLVELGERERMWHNEVRATTRLLFDVGLEIARR